jgi:hypothetical protein
VSSSAKRGSRAGHSLATEDAESFLLESLPMTYSLISIRLTNNVHLEMFIMCNT